MRTEAVEGRRAETVVLASVKEETPTFAAENMPVTAPVAAKAGESMVGGGEVVARVAME